MEKYGIVGTDHHGQAHILSVQPDREAAVVELGRLVMGNIKSGQIVHRIGGRRRYIIAFRNKWGNLGLVALTGAMPGCNPTQARPEDYELDANQTPIAGGPNAARLRTHYRSNLAMARRWGEHQISPVETI